MNKMMKKEMLPKCLESIYSLLSPYIFSTTLEICVVMSCLIVPDSHSSLKGIVGLVHMLNLTLCLIAGGRSLYSSMRAITPAVPCRSYSEI